MRRFAVIGFLALSAAVYAIPASAAAITGSFNLTGQWDVRIGTSWIDWGSDPTGVYEDPTGCVPGPNAPGCDFDGTTTGEVRFTSGDGSFTGVAGTFGLLKDLEDSFAPVGSSFSLTDFLTMNAFLAYEFTLTFINSGSGTAAGCTNTAGDVCTPPGSPFTITNLAGGGSLIGFSVMGTIYDGIGPVTMFTGRWSTQSPLTAAQLLAAIALNGFVAFSNSGNFEANIIPIPEPATLLLFGTGATALAVARRRKQKKSRV